MTRRPSKRDLTGLPLLMWLPECRGRNREGDRFLQTNAIYGDGSIWYTITWPLADEEFYELFFQYRHGGDSLLFNSLEDAKAFAERDFRVKNKPKSKRQSATDFS